MMIGISSALAADIYRWIDDNGNQVYSDQPTENAEKVELRHSMIYTPVEIPELSEDAMDTQSEEADAPIPAPNYKLSVVSPENDAGIRVNNGNVMVNLQLIPALVPERGDLIQLYLDGLPAGMPMPQPNFMLENLDRGTHKLSAVVLNASGEVLAQSETITFHLQRTSVLQPGRQSDGSTGPGAPSIPGFPTTPGFPTVPATP